MSVSELAPDLVSVKYYGWRVVLNPKRARKLRKRGEEIKWSSWFNGWMWLPIADIEEVQCNGCQNYGEPNYDGDRYYCGGSERCIP